MVVHLLSQHFLFLFKSCWSRLDLRPRWCLCYDNRQRRFCGIIIGCIKETVAIWQQTLDIWQRCTILAVQAFLNLVSFRRNFHSKASQFHFGNLWEKRGFHRWTFSGLLDVSRGAFSFARDEHGFVLYRPVGPDFRWGFWTGLWIFRVSPGENLH